MSSKRSLVAQSFIVLCLPFSRPASGRLRGCRQRLATGAQAVCRRGVAAPGRRRDGRRGALSQRRGVERDLRPVAHAPAGGGRATAGAGFRAWRRLCRMSRCQQSSRAQKLHGVRRQSTAATALWQTAGGAIWTAARSGTPRRPGTRLHRPKGGVALRLPPQSKTSCRRCVVLRPVECESRNPNGRSPKESRKPKAELGDGRRGQGNERPSPKALSRFGLRTSFGFRVSGFGIRPESAPACVHPQLSHA